MNVLKGVTRKMKRVKYLIFAIFSMFLATFSVSASSYTPTTNLFENTYSNNLIDMAYLQISNFTRQKYVVFQIDYDYYLVSSKDVTVNDSTLVFDNSTVIRAQRITSGYNSNYEYSTYTENQTSVYLSYIVIGNTQSVKTVTNSNFEDYKSSDLAKMFYIFVIGLLFAIFLLKGRSYL